PLGLLSSTGAFALFRAIMPPEAFEQWGWRIPFFLSGLLIAVGLIIRMRIVETPLFAQLKKKNQVARAPILEVIRGHWREILLAAGSGINEQSCFYLFSVYVLAYGKTELRVTEGLLLAAVNLGAALEFGTIPLFGMASDHLSRKGTYIAGSLFLILFAFPYY